MAADPTDDPTPDKPAVIAALLALLSAALDSARRAHAAAVEGATHTEARAENPKDTRGLEQSYLARGQAKRVADLEAAVAAVTALPAGASPPPVALGALVTCDENGRAQRLLLAPAGGGSVVLDVQVVTPTSPLGRALLGKAVGDSLELRLPGRVRSLTITDVR